MQPETPWTSFKALARLDGQTEGLVMTKLARRASEGWRRARDLHPEPCYRRPLSGRLPRLAGRSPFMTRRTGGDGRTRTSADPWGRLVYSQPQLPLCHAANKWSGRWESNPQNLPG